MLREATRIKRIAAVAALAVFSHWLLDLVVHLGDLPIYDNVAKVGFGLWRDPLTALALESLLYFGAVLLYQRHRAIALSALGIIILAIQVVAFWGPVLPNAKTAAAVFLGGYFVLAAAVRWIERRPILRSSF